MLRGNKPFYYLVCVLGLLSTGCAKKKSTGSREAAVTRDGCHGRDAGCAAVSR